MNRAQLLRLLLLLHTHFLCLAPFFLSFLSASESYFSKQCNSRVLNNVIKAGENRCVLFVEALLPIESAGRIYSLHYGDT